MIAVAIEVYSAVSNYYDKFAKSRVILVDEKLRKKVQKLRELEQILKKVNDRSHSLDESTINSIPKLIPEDELNEISGYYDYEFSDHNLGKNLINKKKVTTCIKIRYQKRIFIVIT